MAKTFTVSDPGVGRTLEIGAASVEDLQGHVAVAFRQPGFLSFKKPESEGGAHVMVTPCEKFEDLPSKLEWTHQPQGRSAHEDPPARAVQVPPADIFVPEWLSELFASLADQVLQRHSLHWDEEEYAFDVLPLGAPLGITTKWPHQLYMLPVYRDAIKLLLGDAAPPDVLPAIPSAATAPLPMAAATGAVQPEGVIPPCTAAASGAVQPEGGVSPPTAAALGPVQPEGGVPPASGPVQPEGSVSPPSAAASGPVQPEGGVPPPTAAPLDPVQPGRGVAPPTAAASGPVQPRGGVLSLMAAHPSIALQPKGGVPSLIAVQPQGCLSLSSAAASGPLQAQGEYPSFIAAALGPVQPQASTSCPMQAASPDVEQQAPQPSSSPKRLLQPLDGAAEPSTKRPSRRDSGSATTTSYLSYLLLGVAGVGKSTFLFVLSWVLLRLNKTILLQLHSHDTEVYVVRRGVPVRGLSTSSKEAKQLLATPGNWYLCDSVAPITVGVKANTLCVKANTASPKADKVFNTYRKESLKVWFGPWTLTDLQCANAVSEVKLATAEVVARHAVVGGSVRAVFLPDAAYRDAAQAVYNSINNATTEELITGMQATAFREDMSNKVFHVTVSNADRPLGQGPICFASAHVGSCVLQTLCKKGYDEVQRFMLACNKSGIFQAANGYLFETCVDKALAEGCRWDLVHLESGTRLQLQLPRLKLNLFKELSEVALAGNGLWVPERRGNWAVADQYVVLSSPVLSDAEVAKLRPQAPAAAAAIKGATTFVVQTTVADSHHILASKYDEQRVKLKTTMFVWAVPADPALTKPQPLVNKDVRKARKRPPPIHQFAMLLPQHLDWAHKAAEAASQAP